MSLIGEDCIDELPAAALAWAWYGIGAGEPDLVKRAVAAAERSTRTGPLADGSPSLTVAVAMVRVMMANSGLQGLLRDTQIVRDAGDPTINPWWTLATAARGTAFSMLGDLDQARALFVQSLSAASDSPMIEAGALAHLALIELQGGDVVEADRLASRALLIAERHDLDGVSPVIAVFAIGALVAAAPGTPGEAGQAASNTQLLLARLGDLSPRTALLGYLVLAQAAVRDQPCRGTTPGGGSRTGPAAGTDRDPPERPARRAAWPVGDWGTYGAPSDSPR